ncbi:MAG: ATP-binding protein [Deltaproteobacteria bacterium]|nr:ATP-binding protein [Deltaproteobacteria bacterium]
MYKRLISLPNSGSFFVFGQRGTGKSTLLRQHFSLTEKASQNVIEIDLLDSRTYLELSRSPWNLRELVANREIVFIDEIQKIPMLLNEVHKLIEDKRIRFALTGSSARKFRKAGVNLLAGQAHEYKLYSLSFQELGKDFNLSDVLQWGSLPSVVNSATARDKEDFLYFYVNTYLKEEIILEQLVRKIEPFSAFLEVAAQSNGENINYENIAKDSRVVAISVKNYFSILVDTLIRFYLPAYHTSKRKRQKKAPKFYFYDLGIVRALQNNVSQTPQPGSFEYGKLFKSFVINEIIKLDAYKHSRYEFSHLRVNDKDEIDLIIERPGKETLLVEIKSKDKIDSRDCASGNKLLPEFKNARAYLLSLDKTPRQVEAVKCLFWQQGIEKIFS